MTHYVLRGNVEVAVEPPPLYWIGEQDDHPVPYPPAGHRIHIRVQPEDGSRFDIRGVLRPDEPGVSPLLPQAGEACSSHNLFDLVHAALAGENCQRTLVHVLEKENARLRELLDARKSSVAGSLFDYIVKGSSVRPLDSNDPVVAEEPVVTLTPLCTCGPSCFTNCTGFLCGCFACQNRATDESQR